MGLFKKKIELKLIKQDDGAIVFNKATGTYFQVNNIGARILELQMEGKNINQISFQLSKEFQIKKEIIYADIIDFIKSFQNRR